MKENIQHCLSRIERDNNIKILFAVENGSRSWGLESKDSDYDVRFVFVRPLKDYIQINRPKEVIDVSYNISGEQIGSQGALIDIGGFDIFKFTKMLSASNPTVIEWLTTDIVYAGERSPVFVNFAKEHFNPTSLYFHYKNMCKSNYLKYLHSGNLVTYKKYLYAYRGLVNAKWIAKYKRLPPIEFIHTINAMQDILPQKVYNRLKDIVYLKQQGKEKAICANLPCLDEYLEIFLKNDEEAPRVKKYGIHKELDKELQRIVITTEK